MVHSDFVEFRFCEMLGSHVCYDTRAFASPLCAVDLIKVKSSVGLLADYRPDSFSAKTGSTLNNGDARADARTEGGRTDGQTDGKFPTNIPPKTDEDESVFYCYFPQDAIFKCQTFGPTSIF